MAFVAAAIVGGAVVGGIATTVAANRAAGAVEAGSALAADATVQSTQLQVDEIRRQFDFQQQILQPFVQNQYAGQSAYMDLLGIGGGAQAPDQGGPAPNVNMGGGPGPQPTADPYYGGADYLQGGRRGARREDGGARRDQYGNYLASNQPGPSGTGGPGGPQYPGAGSTRFNYGDRGQFIDPNLDPTRLADSTRLGDTVRGNLLAGTNLQGDEFRQDVAGRSLAAGAAGTNIYGDVFEASPGYEFQVEEMGRELDRRNSAGGNYGGRAIMEAQRRARGLAAGDYYNWASGRSRDVDRLTAAERADATRLDAAGVNYFGRRAGDASRLDAASAQEDRLQATDQQRSDQAYYNYLQSIGQLGGVGGNAAGQAVQSSQAAGGAVAGAYGNQGAQLSRNYQQLGTDQANIIGSQYASYNDIFQGAIGNAVTAGVI